MLFDSRALIFDLDGTLLDTLPDIASAVNAALRQLALPLASLPEVRTWVGDGAAELIGRALQHRGGKPGDRERALACYFDAYARQPTALSEPFPGVAETLAALAQRGLRLGVCTNKLGRFAEVVLEHFGIARFFQAVVGGDSLPVKKPDPAPLLCTAQRLGVSPGQCLMVGDSRNDILAARAAGMPVVGVSYGYNYGEPIGASRPDAVIGCLSELPALLA